MGALTNFFHKGKKPESAVLIDIGTDSVAGAYASYKKGGLPTLLYTRRLPVEIRKNETPEDAMLRALTILSAILFREGRPVLLRAIGKGESDSVLVCIDAPWQKTAVRTERIEQPEGFIFSKSIVAETLKKTAVSDEGEMLVDESIIGTIANGYETLAPYGKKMHRASIVVLTSHINEKVAHDVIGTLRAVYHSQPIITMAGSSLRYQAMLGAFPHEPDSLILDATGPRMSVALVRKGLLVSIAETAPANNTDASGDVGNELAEIGKQYPLPRTIFLLARESGLTTARTSLESANVGKLWLSDEPPKIVSILPSHLVAQVRQVSEAPPDLLLLLLALFWRHRISDTAS